MGDISCRLIKDKNYNGPLKIAPIPLTALNFITKQV